jgi:hypothetical protein
MRAWIGDTKKISSGHTRGMLSGEMRSRTSRSIVLRMDEQKRMKGGVTCGGNCLRSTWNSAAHSPQG